MTMRKTTPNAPGNGLLILLAVTLGLLIAVAIGGQIVLVTL